MKKFFNSKLLRERVLMLVFIGIGVLWWGSALVRRIGQNSQTWHLLGQEEALQREWLGKGATINDRTEKMAKKLDPAKTMNAAQAYAEVSRLTAGLSAEMGAQRTDPSENITVHSLNVTLRRVDMAGLIRFYEGISSRAPYLGIEQCAITIDRGSPGLVTAVFRIYSIEAR
ncbi:MAG TPA: hypothetical protein VG734_26840 [Lacunisphaera sp.]|nr:hypothetical protein [Lacunisphaera sp.]